MDQEVIGLNGLLTGAYEKVAEMEQRMMIGVEKMGVTISELHMLEYIGQFGKQGRTISDIAAKCSKTLPSITVAIKKLEKKGYVDKIKSSKDGRLVHVVLTKVGQRLDAVHRYFHRNMIRELLKRMNDEDSAALRRGLTILNEFLDHTLLDLSTKSDK